ncbi:M14 family metallopeptidase [[Collinsella] massiliensis]|uniref:Peptidase M14 n=1 Tax=[Collinsella] massiliensis TaxID=1232426 RepID=A0A1Y3XTU3_9ACTN|nr:M14 family metallopeptidase [[Collinsella] massiliensis]OUN88935.1 peptidase M14 [[Collinsella] massiliensis]
MRGKLKGVAVSALGVALALVLGGCSGGGTEAIAFKNVTGEGADVISMTEARSFEATLPVSGQSVEELQQLIDDGKVTWSLSREEGMQEDTEAWPYQYLGGPIEEWETVETSQQPQTELFTNIETTAEEVDGGAALKLTFDSNTMFGYDGIDNRDRSQLRDTILDYTGTYELTCDVDGKTAGTAEVDVRPYDQYRTQAEIDAELPELVDEAKENGLYAEVVEIGQSAEGRPINAVFVTKEESDLDEYLELTERMETEPATVQEEVEAGTLEYKVPIVYSNIHADEIIGSDGVMEFLRALVKNEPIEYRTVAGLTEEGQATLEQEMASDGTAWSELIADDVTGVGYIQGEGQMNPTDDPEANPDASVDLTDEEFARYYNVEDRTLDPDALLDDVFFILVPSENVDGRTYNVRTGGNGLDLNRDNTYQTQPETQAMTELIAKWEPISLHEIHGYYTQFQVEPCSPTHDPNNEYDLFIDTAMQQGEAFAAAAISNNDTINSVQIPMRDYLKVTDDGSLEWVPFDDMSSSYTPQYAMLHGVNAYTVELPYGSQDAVTAVKYGFVGNAEFVSENKDEMFLNQLERYERGIENIDADEIRPYYVSQSDEVGAEADVFRPRYEENNNFFPEYYVIPVDSDAQLDRAAAAEMVEYLLRNDVRLEQLTEDFEVNGTTYAEGTVVVDMHQAKRNMANAALYENMVIDDWTSLYSEPVTNFPDQRGFDCDTITTPGAFDDAALTDLAEPIELATEVDGEGDLVVIENSGVESIRAVNALLDDGVQVGLVTEGESAGDYVVASSDFDAVKDDFVLDAHKVAEAPTAQVIKTGIKVYVPGAVDEFMTNEAGEEYGVRDYQNRLNTTYNMDIFALTEQMGFTLVDSPEEADIIVGNQALSEDEGKLVAEGKPYVGYTANALESAAALGVDVTYNDDANMSYDALTTVEFPEESIVTATYVGEGDDLMYGYGGTFITGVPEGATVLIKTTDDDPIEGFMSAEAIEAYKGTIQAFDYQADGYNMTLFANTLTNKAHQQDEYRYLSAAVYSKLLEGDFEA